MFPYFLLVLVWLLTMAALAVVMLRVRSLIFTRSPFISVPEVILPDIISALALQPKSVLYDLGCGEARVLLAGAQAQPTATFIGLENRFYPRFMAVQKIKRQKIKANIKITKDDLFKADFSGATHIFTYLFPACMAELEPKFIKLLKPGSRVVSCDFPLPNRQPDKVIKLDREKQQLCHDLYIYDF